MRLPEKEYYSLKEVADQRGCTVNDLLHYAETGKLELCVTIYPGFYEVGEEPENGPFWPIDTKKEYLTGGLYSVCLHYKIYENKWLLGIRHPQKKDAYLFLSKRNNYVISKITELLVTHKEKLRFKAAHELASNNDIEKKRPAHRVRSNELYDVIWAAYCDLQKRHDAPTSGQVWQKLQGNYEKYDTEGVIDDITEKAINWKSFKGSERTLKESSFKGTLCKIKKEKNISKNSK
jgi:hypothetical protein